MIVLAHFLGAAADPCAGGCLDPGEAGWGDVIFVAIWAAASLALAAYYCYRAFFTR